LLFCRKGAILTEMIDKLTTGKEIDLEYIKSIVPQEKLELSLKAIELMKKSRFKLEPQTLELILRLQHETFNTLTYSGVDPNGPIRNIPAINKLQLPLNRHNSQKDKAMVLEVFGSNEAGKSSAINEVKNKFDPHLFIFQENSHDARFTPRRTLHDYTAPVFNFLGIPGIYELYLTHDSSIDYENNKYSLNLELYSTIDRMKSKKQKYSPIIADRWFISDRIYTQTKFLEGLASPTCHKYFGHPENAASDVYKMTYAKANYAAIMCLVEPNKSLERRNSNSPSKLPPTLRGTFHEQLLYFHLQTSFQPKLFPYICLDFSSDDRFENAGLLENSINAILTYFKD
jgi:deoxyadenosine/deoxycytidine kinase